MSCRQRSCKAENDKVISVEEIRPEQLRMGILSMQMPSVPSSWNP